MCIVSSTITEPINMDEETKQKTNTRSKSSLRYEYIIVFCTVLMVTFIYALSLHERIFQRQQTNQFSEWIWFRLSWINKDIDNLQILLEILKEDLYTIYFVLLQALVTWRNTIIISGVCLTFARILKYFYIDTRGKKDSDIGNNFKESGQNIEDEMENRNQNEAKNMPYRLYNLLSKLSWKTVIFNIMKFMLLVSFLASLRPEYSRMVETEKAKKMAVLGRGVPIQCRSANKLTYTESFKNLMSNLLSWQHDPCEEYHTAVSVDPSLEINFFMVLPNVLLRSAFQAIELFFGMMGKSLRLFFAEIPAQWQIIIWTSGLFLTIVMPIVLAIREWIKRPRNPNIEPNTAANRTKSQTACNIGKESGHKMIDFQEHSQDKDENKKQFEQNGNDSCDDIVQEDRVKLEISKNRTKSLTAKTFEIRKSGNKKRDNNSGQQKPILSKGGNIDKKKPSSNRFVRAPHKRIVNTGDRTPPTPTKALHKKTAGIDDNMPRKPTVVLHQKTDGIDGRMPPTPTKALHKKTAGIVDNMPPTPIEALNKKTAGIDDRMPPIPIKALHKKTAGITARMTPTPTEALHQKTAGIDDRMTPTPTIALHNKTAGIDNKTKKTTKA